MADRETTRIKIDTDGQPIDVWEFSYFLYHLRAIYAFILDDIIDAGLNNYSSLREIEDFARNIIIKLNGIPSVQVTNLAKRELAFPLTIVDIRRENPIHIDFGGIAIALTVAVIISGGKFKGPGFEIKLPPLGVGIAALREALGRKPTRKKKK